MALPAGTTQSCSIPALFDKRCERRQTASSGKRHNETPTVRKTPPLPLRPMLRTPQPHMSDAAGMRTRRERSERSVRTATPPALQECQMRLASHARRDAPKEVERPAPPHRRGETPHLLGSSTWHRTPRRRTVPVRHSDAARRRISVGRHLLQYVTRRATANSMMKLRRFTKRLRYRCGRCFANFNHPFPAQEDRACRGRHEDAEGAQRAQCPNSSATPPRHIRRDLSTTLSRRRKTELAAAAMRTRRERSERSVRTAPPPLWPSRPGGISPFPGL